MFATVKFDPTAPSALPAAASCCGANTSVVSLRTQLAILLYMNVSASLPKPASCVVPCWVACFVDDAAVAGLADSETATMQTLASAHVD